MELGDVNCKHTNHIYMGHLSILIIWEIIKGAVTHGMMIYFLMFNVGNDRFDLHDWKHAV